MYSRDFDPSEWDLPPLGVDDAAEPPPERDGPYGGVFLGSELGSIRFSRDAEFVDLGEAVVDGFAAVQPGLVELARLGSTDFGSLTATERVDALVVLEQQRAWLDGMQQQLLAEVAVHDTSTEKWAREEVAAALGLAPVTAGSRLKNAEQLCTRLPATLDALLAGRITGLKATAITEASYVLADSLLPAFEHRVLKRAPEQTLAQLRQSVKRAVLRFDPASAEQRRQRAVEDRCVRISDAGDGMAWLTALLPAPQAQACYAKLDAGARLAPPQDPRTLDQLRADLFVDAVLTGLSGQLPTKHGLQPNISVIVSLETLAGVEDEPGWLDGYGPVTADTARELASDQTGTWRRLIIDPIFGQVIDYGTTRYRPPKHLTELVIAREGTCVFPPCNRPARSCELDHLIRFPDGDTSAENLAPECKRDHTSKHQAGWTVRRNPDGTTTWTSPQGREYTSHPPERWALPGD